HGRCTYQDSRRAIETPDWNSRPGITSPHKREVQDMTHATQKPAGWGSARQQRGVLILVIGCLALAAPFFAGPLTMTVVGLLLVLCGILQMLATFRAPDDANLYSVYLSGSLSILVGVLLLNRPQFILTALTQVVGGFFVIDGI